MSSSKKTLESELLSRYLAQFGEPLPPVLTSDAADWVKEDFMRQALRRVGDGNHHSTLCVGPVGAQHATPCAVRRIGERVSEHASPKGREGVARYAPTEEEKTGKVETPSRHSSIPGRPPLGPRPTSTTPPLTPLLNPGPRALSALTDERLDTAPEGVRDARRRLRGLIPEASRLHLELVVASRDPTAENNKEKAHKLKTRRAKLVAKLCEVLDERDSLWAVIEDYLTKADG